MSILRRTPYLQQFFFQVGDWDDTFRDVSAGSSTSTGRMKCNQAIAKGLVRGGM